MKDVQDKNCFEWYMCCMISLVHETLVSLDESRIKPKSWTSVSSITYFFKFPYCDELKYGKQFYLY